MSEYDKNTCNICFGDHPTCDCPERLNIPDPPSSPETQPGSRGEMKTCKVCGKETDQPVHTCASPEPQEGSRGKTPRTDVELTLKRLAISGGDLDRTAVKIIQQLKLRAERAEHELANANASIVSQGDSSGRRIANLEDKLAAAEQELSEVEQTNKTLHGLMVTAERRGQSKREEEVKTLSQHNLELREALETCKVSRRDFERRHWVFSFDEKKVQHALSSTTPSTDWVKRSDIVKVTKAFEQCLNHVKAMTAGDWHELGVEGEWESALTLAKSLLVKDQT